MSAYAGDWRDGALCAQTDPELFFDNRRESIELAKSICGRCDVSAQCESSLAPESENYGVVFGLTADERREHPDYVPALPVAAFLPPEESNEDAIEDEEVTDE